MAFWTTYEQEVALDLSKNPAPSEWATEISSTRGYPDTTAFGLPSPPVRKCATRAATTLRAPTRAFAAPIPYVNISKTSPLEACVAYAATASVSPPMQAYASVYQHQYPYYSCQYQPVEIYPERNSCSPSKFDSDESLDGESLSDNAEYQRFEEDALQAMATKNGGTLLGNNPRMRRAVQTTQAADDAYRRQRERNNFAAKQSRDRRKMREVRLALQVAFLKKKVAVLKTKLASRVCDRCRL